MGTSATIKTLEERLNAFESKKLIWATDLCITAFIILFLGGYHYEYLYKIQNSSLFLSNDIFFHETMENSAGLLLYIGRYLTQYLYYPWLGALLLSAGDLVLMRLMHQFNPNRKFWGLDYLPIVLLLLAQTTITYEVFCNFDSAIVVTLEIGLLSTMTLAYLMEKLHIRFGKKSIIANIALTAIAIYLLGIFGAMSLLLHGILQIRKTKSYACIAIACSVILHLALSFLVSKFDVNEPYIRTLLAPLPHSYFALPLRYSLLTLTMLVLVNVVPEKFAEKKATILVNLSLIIVAALGTYYFTNRDINYRTEIKLQRLTEQQNWNAIIEEANKLEHPTAIAAQYRFIALHHTDRLWTELFNYPCRFDTVKSNYNWVTTDSYDSDIFFYGSAPNEGYRSAMENWVSKNRDFTTLKFFVNYALLRDEAALAQRYLDLLKQSTFYKSWAEEREKYVGNLQLFLNENPSMKRILDYEVKENHNTTLCNLQKVYAKHKVMTKEQWRYRLILDLFYKNMNQFVLDMKGCHYAFGEELPTYLQEAIIICAMQLQKNELVVQYPIKRDVLVWSQEFLPKAVSYRNKNVGAQDLIANKGTFSYYFVFESLFKFKLKDK